jgi:glutathionylspermidine synthase
MERRTIDPRPGWQQTVEEQGLIYPLTRYPDDSLRPYWDESAYYVFSLPEVEALEEVVEELHRMCLAAADHIVTADRFADLGITEPRVAELVGEAWRRRAELPSVCGRFDLRYDGTGPAKLLEYNADTPDLPRRGREPPVVLDGGPLPGRRPVELPPRASGRRLEETGRLPR